MYTGSLQIPRVTLLNPPVCRAHTSPDERPGVLVLHDLMLHHLLVELTVARKDQDGYVERLKADHGWIGEDVGRARSWGDLGGAALFSLAANRTLLRRQSGYSHSAPQEQREAQTISTN